MAISRSLLLTLQGVAKQGDHGPILHDIHLEQRAFRKLAIMGETGSGKSTLLKIIAGLVQHDTGSVVFEDRPVEGPADRLVPGHEGIAYLSQHSELPKFLRVEQVLRYANTLTEKSAATLYEVCHIHDLLQRRTDELSGGERQRVALAKLLVASPRLLLLDEPFAHLDMVHKDILKSVLRNITRRLKITCTLISHEPSDTLSWADHLIILKSGRIVQQGAPTEVYRNPVNAYVAGLLGSYNHLSGQKAKALMGKLGAPFQGKELFARPEQFRIVKAGKRSAPGVVKEVVFFGRYAEATVAVAGTTLLVHVEPGQCAAGDAVRVAFVKSKSAPA